MTGARGDQDLVRFTLLGPLEVRMNDVDYAPTGPKVLQLLALLLMRAGQVVDSETIIRELWSQQPPRSVRKTMQTYVYHLRQCIERNGLAGSDVLRTKPPGYVFKVDPEQIDVFTFRRMFRRGRDLMAEDRPAEAAKTLRAALALWSGPAMSNVPCGPVLSAYAVDLEEQQHAARYLRIQAEIDAGQHRDLIAELRSLVSENPHDEGLHGQLMRALGLSGRRLEALEMYRELRAKLNEELGLEPCADLQRLQQELLSVGR